MANSLPIEFETKKLDAMLKAFDAIGKAALKANQATNGAGSGGPSAKGTGGQSPMQQARANANASIFQARVQAAQNRQQTLAQLNQIKLQKAQMSLTKQQSRTPDSFGKRIQTAIRSTRFGTTGIEPLIGRTADILGPEAAEIAGPVGLFVMGVTEGGKALKEFADAASRGVSEFNSLRYSTGGTAADAGKLSALSSQIGMTPDQMGAAASSLSSAIDPRAQNVFAISTAQKMGLDMTPPQLGGDPNLSHNLKKLFDKIRADKTDAEAIQDLRNLQLPTDLAKVRNISADKYAALLAQGGDLGAANGSLTGPASDYDTSTTMRDIAAQRAMSPFKKKALELGTKTNTGITNVLSGKNSILDPMGSNSPETDTRMYDAMNQESMTPPLWMLGIEKRNNSGVINVMKQKAKQNASAFAGASLSNAASGVSSASEAAVMAARAAIMPGQGGGIDAEYVRALKEHSAALADHAEAMQGFRMPGNFGNVTRDGALPMGFGGTNLNHVLASDMSEIRLSQF